MLLSPHPRVTVSPSLRSFAKQDVSEVKKNSSEHELDAASLQKVPKSLHPMYEDKISMVYTRGVGFEET